jgi:hypothetical protein
MAKSVSVTVTGNPAPLRKKLQEATQDLSGFAKAQQGFGNVVKLGYAVAASGVVKYGEELIKVAVQDEKSRALLRDAISKTTNSTDAATKSAETYLEKLSLQANVTKDNLRPALGTLVRATGDVTKAQTLLSLSTEISTATGRDLSSVTTALSKAAMGQTTALVRLGVPLSAAAKQSGNFAVAYDELTKKFSGSNAAALETTAGKLSNLSIRFHELQVTTGTLLLPAVNNIADGLIKTASAAQDKNWIGTLTNGFSAVKTALSYTGLNTQALVKNLFDLGIQASNATQNAIGLGTATKDAAEKPLSAFTKWQQDLNNIRNGFGQAKVAAMSFADSQKNLIYSANTTNTQILADRMKQVADALQAAKDKTQAAREKFAALGVTLKQTLAAALEDAKTKLQAAEDATVAFGEATANAITSNVSIGSSLSDATTAEENLTSALEARKKAYENLNMARATGDLAGYSEALAEVAKTEEAVATAQSKKKTPGQLFADQIAKAKKFATDLKTLISPPFNLGQAGLSQLLNLGVDTGSSVASELVAGTGSLTVGAINEGLSSLSTVAAGLGTTAGSIFMTGKGTAVDTAQTNVNNLAGTGITTQNNEYKFTITAGVGDPLEIGRQVVTYLKAYDKKFNGIPIKATNK